MNGFVNFPVNNPAYKDTCEGGLFVRLVIVEDDFRSWMQCCGGQNYYHMDEEFIVDDVRELPKFPDSELVEDIEEWYKKWDSYVQLPFPFYKNKSVSSEQQFTSDDSLAVMTIGSTPWSGLNKLTEEYWKCTYNDLTEEGKLLYILLKRTYKNCKIYLQTWLDT